MANPGEPRAHRRVEIVADEAALAAHAADQFVALASAAIAARGRATVALAGGSTPKAMNALLVAEPRRSAVDWSRVHVAFGDERCVSPDHPESNFGMNRTTLLTPLGIPPERILRMRGEDPPSEAAAEYDALLARELGERPVFDAVFCGMGPDGHTLSLFPGTLAHLDATRRCVHNVAPVGVRDRLTLLPWVVNAARAVVFTAGGAAKAEALAAVLHGPSDPDRYPSQAIAPSDGHLYWIVDAAAAAGLTPAAAAPQLER